jgi:hypothetical protein
LHFDSINIVTAHTLTTILAECILKHGSIGAVHEYLAKLAEEGANIASTPEFVSTNAVSQREDSQSIFDAATAMAREAKNDECHAADAVAEPAIQTRKTPKKRTFLRLFIGLTISFLIGLGVLTFLRRDDPNVNWLPMFEQLSYRTPGAATSALMSPFFIQCLSYQGMFYEEARYQNQELEFNDPILLRAKNVGLALGLCQSVGFYLPIFLFRRRQRYTDCQK